MEPPLIIMLLIWNNKREGCVVILVDEKYGWLVCLDRSFGWSGIWDCSGLSRHLGDQPRCDQYANDEKDNAFFNKGSVM